MPKAGLEPARVSPYASETYVYTNFTTSAYSTVNESKKTYTTQRWRKVSIQFCFVTLVKLPQIASNLTNGYKCFTNSLVFICEIYVIRGDVLSTVPMIFSYRYNHLFLPMSLFCLFKAVAWRHPKLISNCLAHRVSRFVHNNLFLSPANLYIAIHSCHRCSRNRLTPLHLI
jgi:hypothetical protein